MDNNLTDITLVYCWDDRNSADKLVQDLQVTGFRFRRKVVDQKSRARKINKMMENGETAYSILVVSKQFLYSYESMREAARIEVKADAANIICVETSTARSSDGSLHVSNAINYWKSIFKDGKFCNKKKGSPDLVVSKPEERKYDISVFSGINAFLTSYNSFFCIEYNTLITGKYAPLVEVIGGMRSGIFLEVINIASVVRQKYLYI